MNSVNLGDQYTGLGGQTLALNFNINYFTMHLIIAKWVDRKIEIEEEKIRQKEVEAKEETVY